MREQLTAEVLPTEETVPVAYQVRMSDGRWGTIFHHPDKPLSDHRPLYAHPPQPSETVMEALHDADQTLMLLGDTGWRKRHSAALKGENDA